MSSKNILLSENRDLSDITVGIKTFLREEKLKSCLDALVDKGFHQVIIADDGDVSKEKQSIYDLFSKKLNLKILNLPFDSGLSFGRNEIVKNCQTPYLLLLDDDQIISENVYVLKNILIGDPELGGVSAVLFENDKFISRAANLYIKEQYLFKTIGKSFERRYLKNYSYYIFDSIQNCTLFKIDCLRDYPWDDKIKIGKEHIDFYLNLKLNSNWKFAVTPEVIFKHYPSNKKDQYADFRFNTKKIEEYTYYFLKKWKLKNIFYGIFFIDDFNENRKIIHQMYHNNKSIKQLKLKLKLNILKNKLL